jgi:hypothetical protein
VGMELVLELFTTMIEPSAPVAAERLHSRRFSSVFVDHPTIPSGAHNLLKNRNHEWPLRVEERIASVWR